MTLNELKEQLQENIRTYLDEYDMYIVDDLCDIVANTFNDTFYDGSLTGIDLVTKTLDTAPSN